MIDLRDALHEASPTDDLPPPDVEMLERRAVRGRRLQRIAVGAAAVTAVALGAAGIAVVGGLSDPDVDVAADPADTDATATDSPARGDPSPVDPAAYQEWREYWSQMLEDSLAAATASQQPALEDDTITEDEWLAAGSNWEACVREAGWEFELRRTDGPPGAPAGVGYDNPDIPDSELPRFDEAVASCWEEHFRAVEALWREQEADHVVWWNWMQEAEADTED